MRGPLSLSLSLSHFRLLPRGQIKSFCEPKTDDDNQGVQEGGREGGVRSKTSRDSVDWYEKTMEKKEKKKEKKRTKKGLNTRVFAAVKAHACAECLSSCHVTIEILWADPSLSSLSRIQLVSASVSLNAAASAAAAASRMSLAPSCVRLRAFLSSVPPPPPPWSDKGMDGWMDSCSLLLNISLVSVLMVHGRTILWRQECSILL